MGKSCLAVLGVDLQVYIGLKRVRGCLAPVPEELRSHEEVVPIRLLANWNRLSH
jgi:hypothetical protein